MTGLPLPRGIRNNNPGNIRHSSADWEGKSPQQTDRDFVMFVSPEFGIRALARNLLTYQSKYHLATIQQIVSRWAPPSENATAAYIDDMSRALGILADTPFDLCDDPGLLRAFIAAMIAHENGPCSGFGRDRWFDNEVIDLGISMAMPPGAAFKGRSV